MTSPTLGGTFSVFSATKDPELDGLLAGTRWGAKTPTYPITITYSFPSIASADYWSTNPQKGYGASSGTEEPWNDFRGLTATEQANTRLIFDMIESYAKINFVEISETAGSVGDIRVGFSGAVDDDASAHAYSPDGSLTSSYEGIAYPYAGDVWVNSDDYNVFDSTPGSYDYHTLIHEIGHAMGFKHPFETEGSFAAIPISVDSYDYTVMSYSPLLGNDNVLMSVYPKTFMPIDVAALQAIYGVNDDYHAGNDTYAYAEGNSYNEVIWDTSGTDTISYESSLNGAVIDLNDGSWQVLGTPIEYYDDFFGSLLDKREETVYILPDVVIENATGSGGDDKLTGNEADNILSGMAGDDTLDGGAGSNTLIGGEGSDNYYLRNSTDTITESGTSLTDIDIVYSYLSDYTLADNVEQGWILVAKTATLTGNAADNTLYAGKGNNVLTGGTGSDTASFANMKKAIKVGLTTADPQKTGGSGTDTLISIENLTGSNYNDKLTGNSGDNILTGGSGRDTLVGGEGVDTFLFESVSTSTSSKMDIITDFSVGTDKIDLSAIDANTATTMDDPFTAFIDASSSFSAAGQLKLSGGILYGNTDSDVTAEFAIKLTGVSSLALSDLVA